MMDCFLQLALQFPGQQLLFISDKVFKTEFTALSIKTMKIIKLLQQVILILQGTLPVSC